MTRTPVHAGFRPHPLHWRRDTGDGEHVAALTGAAAAERGRTADGRDSACFRLTLQDGSYRFGKIVPSANDAREREGAQLSALAARHGVPALTLDSEPRPFDGTRTVWVWPWVDGAFASGTLEEMRALGSTLAALHACLGPAAAAPAASRSAMWGRLRSLRDSNALDPSLVPGLEAFVARGASVDDVLGRDAWRLHDDLHPGNVLFDADGNVAAVLDLEEAVDAAGTRWLDLSWVIERFCFLGPRPQQAGELAAAFLETYRAASVPPPIDGSMLADLMRWRCYRALSLLAEQRDARDEGEWSKFSWLASRIDGWLPQLDRVALH